MAEGLSKEGLDVPPWASRHSPLTGKMRRGRSKPNPGELVPKELPTMKGTSSAQGGEKQAPWQPPVGGTEGDSC